MQLKNSILKIGVINCQFGNTIDLMSTFVECIDTISDIVMYHHNTYISSAEISISEKNNLNDISMNYAKQSNIDVNVFNCKNLDSEITNICNYVDYVIIIGSEDKYLLRVVKKMTDELNKSILFLRD